MRCAYDFLRSSKMRKNIHSFALGRLENKILEHESKYLSEESGNSRRGRRQSTLSDLTDTRIATDESANASEKINLQNLIELKQSFDAADLDGGGKLDPKEFLIAFGNVLGQTMTSKQIGQLFMKIDANSDGTVEWDEFMNYILLENQSLSLMKEEHFEYAKNLEDDPSLAPRGHHTETITKIIKYYDLNDKVNKYLTSSKDGTIKIWSADMQPLSSIDVSRHWIMDLVYLEQSDVVAAATEDKCISFYNLAQNQNLIQTPVHNIADLEGTPLCLSQHTSRDYTKKEILFVGDDEGICHIYDLKKDWHICSEDMKCHRDRLSERRNKIVNEKVKKISEEKDPQIKWRLTAKKTYFKVPTQHLYQNVDVTRMKIHNNWITKLEYYPELSSLVSSSLDHMIHFHDIEKFSYKRSFTFHQKSVLSFAWCNSYRFMASCGEERHVVLWNPFTCKPTSILQGHTSAVVDVIFNEPRNHLLTFGADKIVRVWDIRNSKCLQTITDRNRYKPENRYSYILFEDDPERLLITTKKINVWNFRTYFETHEQSHDYAVIYCGFNDSFDSIISVDEMGNVCVWDIFRGGMKFKYNQNGNDPSVQATTAMIDESERRLFVGNSAGHLKIWNFNNSQLLREFSTKERVEISCLAYVVWREEKDKDRIPLILAGGWEKRIYIWTDEDKPRERTIPAGSHTYSKDIVSICYQSSTNMVITGYFDGSILASNFETSLVKYYLHGQDPTCCAKDLSREHKACEKILNLDEDRMILTVSSDQYIRGWDLESGRFLFRFRANHNRGETLTTACLDKNRNYMATGDSGGYIKLWDITELNQYQYGAAYVKELYMIKAHTNFINCVEIFECEKAEYIVSASSDKNVNLFTLGGHFIGNMGRADGWNLKDPSTYLNKEIHHITPNPEPPESNESPSRKRTKKNVRIESNAQDDKNDENKLPPLIKGLSMSEKRENRSTRRDSTRDKLNQTFESANPFESRDVGRSFAESIADSSKRTPSHHRESDRERLERDEQRGKNDDPFRIKRLIEDNESFRNSTRSKSLGSHQKEVIVRKIVGYNLLNLKKYDPSKIASKLDIKY